MEVLSVIGSFSSIIALVISIIAYRKACSIENKFKTNKEVKGLFFSGSTITQKDTSAQRSNE